ncbi:MAG: DUF3450 family protein [Verrucomicrobiota bacterium]
MSWKTLVFLIPALSLSASPEALDNARTVVKEWVTTEKAISREAADWVQREQLLQDLITVETQRIERLEEELTESEAGVTAADDERADLLAREDLALAKSRRIEAFLAGIESDLHKLQSQLPEPLADDLEAAYQRLPADGEDKELNIGERMRTVVSMMGRIRQFDSALHLSESIRDLPGDGSEASVRTLYIGLGQAYYLAPNDAGYGVPTESGWQWESQPELGSAILEAIQLLDGELAEPRFINLPVHGIANKEVAE